MSEKALVARRGLMMSAMMAPAEASGQVGWCSVKGWELKGRDKKSDSPRTRIVGGRERRWRVQATYGANTQGTVCMPMQLEADEANETMNRDAMLLVSMQVGEE